MLQIVLKVSPDVVDIEVSCHLFVVCVYIYMFGWLCRATFCSGVSTSMLGVSHAVQTRRNCGSLNWVIGKVLVLGLLVVCKIPYSSCISNTAVVLEQGTMVCVPILLSIWYIVVACVTIICCFYRCRGYWIGVFCCLFVVRIYVHLLRTGGGQRPPPVLR